MLTLDKEKIIKSLQDLPEKTTLEEAIERLNLLAEIEKELNKQTKANVFLMKKQKKR